MRTAEEFLRYEIGILGPPTWEIKKLEKRDAEIRHAALTEAADIALQMALKCVTPTGFVILTNCSNKILSLIDKEDP